MKQAPENLITFFLHIFSVKSAPGYYIWKVKKAEYTQNVLL